MRLGSDKMCVGIGDRLLVRIGQLLDFLGRYFRVLTLTSAIVLSACERTADLPDTRCKSVKSVWVLTDSSPSDAATGDVEKFGFVGAGEHQPVIYRFIDGSLYLDPPDRSDYFHNEVFDESFGNERRYRSGYKTIIFDPSFSTAVDTHIDRYTTRIFWLECQSAAQPS